MRVQSIAAALLAACALAACGGADDGETASTTAAAPTEGVKLPADREPGGAGHGGGDSENAPPQNEEASGRSGDDLAVARAVRAYVEGLDARDGAAVCSLLVPGTIESVDLPRDRSSCAAALRASIGYRDPRGLPVWSTARVAEVPSVEVTGDTAKAVVTTVTRFADRKDVSIEDDVVYLRRSGERWLIAKPSSTLYRAVGIADVPPSVLAPP